jgi:type II secretory pathway component PulF
MASFSYKAINESGQTLSGSIEAESQESATAMLSGRGFIPVEVNATGSAGAARFNFKELKARLTPVKTQDLMLFTKQFRTMIKAGISMLQLLQVLETQTDNPQLKNAVNAMAIDIQEGASLYEAFRKHPRLFSPLYCSMVQAGESSGALPEVMDRLIYIIDHEHRVKSDIRSALQYPVIVMVALAVAFFVLLTFVIPKFVNIFLTAGLDLPIPTKICMWLYNVLNAYGTLLIGAAAAILVAAVYYLRTEQGRYVRDFVLLKLPVLGNLFQKAAMARFASIFSILQSSGVSVMEAMRILSGTIGNLAISREFDRISGRLEEGLGIAEPLRTARYFTPIVTNMVAIGEESGNLDEMLNEVSDHYDVELEYAMKKLSDAIAPTLTVGLAIVVGFFALAIFLPMWDLVGVVK